MTVNPCTIAPMSRADLDLAIDWAAAEGWNPGLNDAQAFLAQDPGGFLMARVDGRPAASISVVKYDGSYGFLGLYIAAPDFRGQGHGYQLWQAGMERLDGMVVGLDGVIAQQDNYRRSGFVLAHRNIRYVAPTCPVIAMPDEAWRVPLDRVPRDLLLAYDRQCFPGPRAAFLETWIGAPGHHGVGILADGRLKGYAVARPCRDGHKIGPLFADDPGTAESLFLDLCMKVGTGKLFLDIPETNKEALSLVERFRMTPMFETARMYRGPAPAVAEASIYGITSFELG